VPSRIDGIATGVPQAAKPRHVTVTNSRFLEGAGETIAIELRIVPRAWNCANVDQLLYAVSKQQVFKFFDRSRRVPHSENHDGTLFCFSPSSGRLLDARGSLALKNNWKGTI
jgi:hypothetical protein